MKGILFKPDMIKAIVEGGKTVTRRVMQNQPYLMDKVYDRDFRKDFGCRKPRYQVGEVVYIKEVAWYGPQEKRVEYDLTKTEAVNAEFYGAKRKSPLFMPEWTARYFIKIKDVRAERLQEITEEDAEKEGFKFHIEDFQPGCSYLVEAREKYQHIWNLINKAYPWESNPWVWRYEFELVSSPAQLLDKGVQ